MAQTAIVTGASRGIGRAVCAVLAARGVRVVAVARSAAALDDLARTPGITPVAGDVRDDDTIRMALRAAADASGGASLDSLILNAGHLPNTAVATPEVPLAADALAASMDVNAYAPLRWLRHALPALRASRGRVLYVGTPLGISLGAPGMAPYAMSKAAAVAALRCAAAEERLRDEGDGALACILAVAPGIVHTALMGTYVESLHAAYPGAPGARALLRAKERLERGAEAAGRPPVAIRTPEEVAEPIARAAMRAPPALSGEFLMFDSAPIRSLSW